MYIYIYICVCVCVCVYIYIYIYDNLWPVSWRFRYDGMQEIWRLSRLYLWLDTYRILGPYEKEILFNLVL